MRFFLFGFLLLLSSGCVQRRDIWFTVNYTIDSEYQYIESNSIRIVDFPLDFQANAEKNYTKVSQVDSVQLVHIQTNFPIVTNSIQFWDNQQWVTLNERMGVEVDTLAKTFNYRFTTKKINWKNCFKDGNKLNMKLVIEEKMEAIQPAIQLTFRIKGKLDKTNVIYRIIG